MERQVKRLRLAHYQITVDAMHRNPIVMAIHRREQAFNIVPRTVLQRAEG